MRAALPQDLAYADFQFILYTRNLFGDLYEPFLRSFSEEPPVSIRLNPFKKIDVSSEWTPIPWCKDGYWLPKRKAFTLDPLFHCGCYYVQEAASMFLDTILRQYVSRPITMLDLCAAPGGKATLSRAALPQGSLLYCNETDRRRANILVENMQKQGHSDVLVTNNSAADYARSGLLFDVLLADVPCSGEGLFRRSDVALKEWSIKNVLMCAERQRNIVRDIWPCLKEDGLLIYSTCTFNTHENEENVRWFVEELGAEVMGVTIDPSWGIVGSLLQDFSSPVYRFIQGITRSEGLFVALLKKTDGRSSSAKQHPTALHILYDGQHIDEYKRDQKTIPPHAEALLCDLPPERYPRAELTLSQALSYLRHETLNLDNSAPRGFVVVCYEGHPLGFVKNIGTRANNLYPIQWRIKNI